MNKTDSEHKKLVSKIKSSNIILPIIIGLGVIGYMIYNEVNMELISQIHFGWKAALMIFIALLFMVGRDFGYMLRLRILCDKELSWLQTFRVIMLWEFTSAVTPSAIGGTSVAVVYVHKEGLSVGRSTMVVLLTSFFDELYFAIMFPLVILILGVDTLFSIGVESTLFETSVMTIALIGYTLKLTYLFLVSYGLFFNPKGFKWILINVFRIPFLRKWRWSAAKAGDDIIVSAKEIRHKNIKFWLSAFFASFLSWSSRYLVVNAILVAFFVLSDHLLLFARQLVMWIMMLIMPTPGGSGFSEYLFKEYLGEFIPVDLGSQIGIAAILALIWRLITYYPYLVIGAVMLPRWINAKFGKNKTI